YRETGSGGHCPLAQLLPVLTGTTQSGDGRSIVANHEIRTLASRTAQSSTRAAPLHEQPFTSPRRLLANALSMALFTGPLFAAEIIPSIPNAPQTWPVQVCDDATGPGSLRYIASHAQSGDTIDLSQLPMLCGLRDSMITLSAGEIVLHQANITLQGP